MGGSTDTCSCPSSNTRCRTGEEVALAGTLHGERVVLRGVLRRAGRVAVVGGGVRVATDGHFSRSVRAYLGRSGPFDRRWRCSGFPWVR